MFSRAHSSITPSCKNCDKNGTFPARSARYRKRPEKCKFLQICGFCGAVFPTKVAIPSAFTWICENIADIRVIKKDFWFDVLGANDRKSPWKLNVGKTGPLFVRTCTYRKTATIFSTKWPSRWPLFLSLLTALLTQIFLFSSKKGSNSRQFSASYSEKRQSVFDWLLICQSPL